MSASRDSLLATHLRKPEAEFGDSGRDDPVQVMFMEENRQRSPFLFELARFAVVARRSERATVRARRGLR